MGKKKKKKRSSSDKVWEPNAKEGREPTDIEVYRMQRIPPDVLAAHYGEEDDDIPVKNAEVDIPSSQYLGGAIPGYPPRPTFGTVPPLYVSSCLNNL
ncbi:hypothetical protein T459_19964 [Capsicum annuum]|uniref:Uncharacterized protein n=1 Tax=Capsicum annuum TaxID=4072 RepID=A0A2G2Z340_CAPAN|nr:hypothetical protein T459_19964 [Capsicum annuum]